MVDVISKVSWWMLSVRFAAFARPENLGSSPSLPGSVHCRNRRLPQQNLRTARSLMIKTLSLSCLIIKESGYPDRISWHIHESSTVRLAFLCRQESCHDHEEYLEICSGCCHGRHTVPSYEQNEIAPSVPQFTVSIPLEICGTRSKTFK